MILLCKKITVAKSEEAKTLYGKLQLRKDYFANDDDTDYNCMHNNIRNNTSKTEIHANNIVQCWAALLGSAQ
jgi:hypothetical protein